MDRVAYIAAGGAARALEQQSVVSNNLANVSTNGFRAQLAQFRAVPFVGEGQATRVGTVVATPGADLTPGPLEVTDRALDVAINGQGWFAVQTPQGEAYTRAGNFRVGATGMLETASGLPVLSDQDQPIAVPENTRISFAQDGSIVMLIEGQSEGNVVLGRLKLVNPPPATLVRGDDGLFRGDPAAGGQAVAQPDPAVRIVAGALEGSNVNPAASMVSLLETSRLFEMQMRAIQFASTNAERANQLLGPGS